MSGINNEAETNKLIDENIIRCAVVIPQDFAHKLNSNDEVNIQLSIEGTEGRWSYIFNTRLLS